MEDADRKHLPRAKLISGGREAGLYDIPKESCLCEYAQGPCYLHASATQNKEQRDQSIAPIATQLELWIASPLL